MRSIAWLAAVGLVMVGAASAAAQRRTSAFSSIPPEKLVFKPIDTSRAVAPVATPTVGGPRSFSLRDLVSWIPLIGSGSQPPRGGPQQLPNVPTPGPLQPVLPKK